MITDDAFPVLPADGVHESLLGRGLADGAEQFDLFVSNRFTLQ